MAAKYDFTIEQGSNHSFQVQYKNADGSVFDFTGYSAKLQARKTAMVGGAAANQLSLAYGHTAVSLATTETATTKASTRIPLGQQLIAANQAAFTELKDIDVKFSPICVYPGEFIAIAAKKIGTAFSSGVIAYTITFSGKFI